MNPRSDSKGRCVSVRSVALSFQGREPPPSIAETMSALPLGPVHMVPPFFS